MCIRDRVRRRAARPWPPAPPLAPRPRRISPSALPRPAAPGRLGTNRFVPLSPRRARSPSRAPFRASEARHFCAPRSACPPRRVETPSRRSRAPSRARATSTASRRSPSTRSRARARSPWRARDEQCRKHESKSVPKSVKAFDPEWTRQNDARRRAAIDRARDRSRARSIARARTRRRHRAIARVAAARGRDRGAKTPPTSTESGGRALIGLLGESAPSRATAGARGRERTRDDARESRGDERTRDDERAVRVDERKLSLIHI